MTINQQNMAWSSPIITLYYAHCVHTVHKENKSTHEFYLIFLLFILKYISVSSGGRHTPQCPRALATPQTSQTRLRASQPRPPAPASITRRSGQPRPHPLRGQQVGWDTEYWESRQALLIAVHFQVTILQTSILSRGHILQTLLQFIQVWENRLLSL